MMSRDRGQIALGILVLIVSVLVLVFTGWVFVNLTDPIFNSLTLAETSEQLGTDASGTVMFFGGLAFIAFIIGLIVWFILRPIGSDVRQAERRRPGRRL